MKGLNGNIIAKRFVVGPLGTNCYIVADAVTRHACLIDPGSDPEQIKNYIKKEGLDLKSIINTHGHGDHIGANAYFRVPILIHRKDADFLTDPDKKPVARIYGWNSFAEGREVNRGRRYNKTRGARAQDITYSGTYAGVDIGSHGRLSLYRRRAIRRLDRQDGSRVR